MKHCLLCDHKEPGNRKPDPDVNYVCSSCVNKLIHWPVKQVVTEYQKACEAENWRVMYALQSFVPRKHRQALPRDWKKLIEPQEVTSVTV